jgi:hypothetical protein
MRVTLLPAQTEIDNKVRDAVNNLASKLVRQWEVSIGDILLEDEDTPSVFSRYLYRMIKLYANQTGNSMFRVIEPAHNRGGPNKQGEPEKAVITGTFAQMGNNVQVNLYLVSELTNAIIASDFFYIPYAQLIENELAIKPVNTPVKIPQNNNPSDQFIKIQALFDSESRTFLHRDELKMSVMADRDCFFKIIHIDVDKKIRMIYPVKENDDNSLRANISRSVFDGLNRYAFYEPYGTETLVVVASPVQFPGIRQEYGQPWKTATEEMISKAIEGAGQAQYQITIIPPYAEYEYKKPQNLTEMYETLKEDTVRQGGYFEGNEENKTSAFYIIGNIRGSYRVSGDMIKFTTYYLDIIPNVGARTRGQPFTFNFTKPQDITHAVQTVRSGIESKGGTFNGNEQQGDFRASGITGRYNVSERVNVTISEKPFVVPNSLIENEVKNFFGVR